LPDVVIENPVINSAFAEPKRHIRFSDDRISRWAYIETREPWDAVRAIRKYIADLAGKVKA